MKPDSRLRITTSRRQTAFQIPSPSSKPNCVGRADRTHKRACGGISVTTLGKSVLAPLRINLLPVSVYRPTHFLCFDPTPPEWGRSQSLRQVGQCNAVRVMTAMRPPWMPATTLETDIQRQRPWYSLWARFGYRWERLTRPVSFRSTAVGHQYRLAGAMSRRDALSFLNCPSHDNQIFIFNQLTIRMRSEKLS